METEQAIILLQNAVSNISRVCGRDNLRMASLTAILSLHEREELKSKMVKTRIRLDIVDKCIKFSNELEDEMMDFGCFEEYRDTVLFLKDYFRKYKGVMYNELCE